MPIDASSNPYDGGLDPDDLTLAGKGAAAAAASSKGIEAAEDDDLADAGKGAAPGGEAGESFDAEGISKDPGAGDDTLDLGGVGGGEGDLLGDIEIDDGSDLLGSKLDDPLDDDLGSKVEGFDDDGDVLTGAKSSFDADDIDDPADKDFDIDV